MILTLVEPHSHFELLLRWIPICVRTDWNLNIVSSTSNWEKLQEWIPEDCNSCEFYNIAASEPFPKSDFVVFLSMQKGWHKWLQIARNHPSALIIHNANTYLRPNSSFAPLKDTGFSSIKYSAKWIYEQLYRIPMRRDFLQSQNFVVPYSTTQMPFLQDHCNKPIAILPSTFKQILISEKVPNVIIHLHNRINHIDIPFFKKCLEIYRSEEYQQIDLICSQKEFQRLPSYFRNNEKIKFHAYPLSTSTYYKLVSKSKYMCLPFRQESVFNIYREFIGITKYSGRIRDALEHGCELHMPDYIPREDPNAIPGLEEAARLMEEKLHEMYKLATS